MPLTQIHLNAQAASRAAEAASNQNKFWEMHDLLYANQTEWAQSANVAPLFESYATQLSLDIARFRSDYTSSATNAAINADVATGQQKKVTGTPTFFLNGKQIDNTSVSTPEKFEAVIDAAIAAKTKQ